MAILVNLKFCELGSHFKGDATLSQFCTNGYIRVTSCDSHGVRVAHLNGHMVCALKCIEIAYA